MEGKNKIVITSYNCRGINEKNHDYLNNIFKNCDFLFLQETWLYKFQHNTLDNILSSCQYHALSAMDDANIARRGRPYGGCSIIWKQSLKLSVINIPTISPRICAVKIDSDNSNCLLASVYMPVDDNSDRNFEIYGDVLYELSSLITMYDDCDILIGGDFNVDFSRPNSRNLNIFKHFINDEDLICPSVNVIANNFT